MKARSDAFISGVGSFALATNKPPSATRNGSTPHSRIDVLGQRARDGPRNGSGLDASDRQPLLEAQRLAQRLLGKVSAAHQMFAQQDARRLRLEARFSDSPPASAPEPTRMSPNFRLCANKVARFG